MKYIFADSIDVIDPRYDFATDTLTRGRQLQWDEHYPHEAMSPPPYDGVLVSHAIVGDYRRPGKYSPPQAMRFRRVGARKFLRLDTPELKHMPIYGDCGSFSYVTSDVPPYTPAEILEFYADAGFTHGFSVDHIIFDYDREESGVVPGSEEARRRFDITLENADTFLRLSKTMNQPFTPVGVAQGWSPSSLAQSAHKMEQMGYDYIALGGLVPLRPEDVHRCVEATRARLKPDTRIHLLGFAKAEQITGFVKYNITSFDSTSPMIRAFKDSKSNYYVEGPSGLEYYTALRIPQALENRTLLRGAKMGVLDQEELVKLETLTLETVRAYDKNQATLDAAVECVSNYASLLAVNPLAGCSAREKMRSQIMISARRTLADRPWKNCPCEICQKLSIEVVIFRSSNRNKRRGFHNLGVFYKHISGLLNKESNSEAFSLPRRIGAAE